MRNIIKILIGICTLSFFAIASGVAKKKSDKRHAEIDKQFNVMSKKEFESQNKK